MANCSQSLRPSHLGLKVPNFRQSLMPLRVKNNDLPGGATGQIGGGEGAGPITSVGQGCHWAAKS